MDDDCTYNVHVYTYTGTCICAIVHTYTVII